MDNAIASFHWSACENCIHRLEEYKNGSTCDIPRDEWESRLEYDMDEMICGSFEEKG